MPAERKPCPGEFYRHFKGKLYQIITIAYHSETAEELVIYQALYQDYRTYARPLSMFISEVDHIKYPEEPQKYRFEKITPTCENVSIRTPSAESVFVTPVPASITAAPVPAHTSDSQKESIEGINPVIIRFLDAESPEERLNVINNLKSEDITQEIIDTISIALDFVPDSGSVEQGLLSIRNYLQTYLKYNGRRLR